MTLRAIRTNYNLSAKEVAKLMKTGRFFVISDKVSKFKDEVYQYIWNEKTGEPVKENDDVLDAVRYAIYSQHSGLGNKIKLFKGGF